MSGSGTPRTPLTDDDLLGRPTIKMTLTPRSAGENFTYTAMANSTPKFPAWEPYQFPKGENEAGKMVAVRVIEDESGDLKQDNNLLTQIAKFVAECVMQTDVYQKTQDSAEEDAPPGPTSYDNFKEVKKTNLAGKEKTYKQKEPSRENIVPGAPIDNLLAFLCERYISCGGASASDHCLFHGYADPMVVFEGHPKVLRVFEETSLKLAVAVNAKYQEFKALMPISVSFFIHNSSGRVYLRKTETEAIADALPCLCAQISDWKMEDQRMVEDIYINIPCHAEMNQQCGDLKDFPMRKTFIQYVLVPSSDKAPPASYETVLKTVQDNKASVTISRRAAVESKGVLGSFSKMVICGARNT